MKNLFKNANEFESYIDILEEKETVKNHHLLQNYNFTQD